MSETTVNLALPYILPSQAQKHVTHNEALQRIDAVAQLAVVASLDAPPSDPAEGSVFSVATGATGLWNGKDGRLAFRQDGAWVFLLPRAGWRGWFLSEERLKVHDGADWRDFDATRDLSRLGINATADETNRLTVRAPASLFDNEEGSHRVTVNKATGGDTASLLFQTGFSGRAEIGLAGSDDLSFKVSADGSIWTEAIGITAAGQVRMPARPRVRATLGGGPATPASGSETGFTLLSLDAGGFQLGSAVAGGSGNRLVVPVAGPYLVFLTAKAAAGSAFTVGVRLNGASDVVILYGHEGGTADHSAVASGIAHFDAGDLVTLHHTGGATLDFGVGATELTVIML
ncbi:DUF2793 domain-containing protein [Ensifer soli]|uniref:DUF2793 domain-containing protein n=1 Tax=Ciceribacter sp. sgz301302 TaxID=3342379 RepID=UPI0035B9CFD9